MRYDDSRKSARNVGAKASSKPDSESMRLEQIIAAWPGQWLGGPLVLSEFALGGVGPSERSLGVEQDWAIIRSRPNVVLGGLAYTWATK